MQSVPVTELNTRARDVFRLVVEAYLETGQPVGSRTLSKRLTQNLSPASIRNVMQDLEELGLLAAPHTSAGRQPTEQGLRMFVDGMMQVSTPTEQDRAQIEDSLRGSNGPVEAALAQATAALSGLSACAGLVLVPGADRAVRSVSFVELSPGRGLMILVDETGAVENRVIALPPGITPSALVEAGNYISATLSGMTLAAAAERIRADIERQRVALDAAARALVERGLAAWSADSARRPVLIVRGQSHLLDSAAASDLDRVRLLLEALESQEEIADLLNRACDGTAARIFIGSENRLFSLSGSSVIAAPYRAGDGTVVGVVGVIGPTRLNYGRIVPMVDFTAQTLSRLMQA